LQKVERQAFQTGEKCISINESGGRFSELIFGKKVEISYMKAKDRIFFNVILNYVLI
jgi:hypothetical protein